jgi:amino acid permease
VIPMGGSERKWGRLELETRESQRLLDRGATEEAEYDNDAGGGHGPSDGSAWGSVFNLCNSAIGAGILALPYAFHQAGVVMGMVCMIVMALMLAFTNKVLVWTNRLNPEAKSYEKLVRAVFGHKTSILVTWSVILTTFGACTGFLVIIADILPPLVKLVVSDPEWVSSRIAVTIAVSVVGILPLASLKNFNSLRFSSTMAIVSVTFTVFVIMFRSARELPLSEEQKDQISYFNYGMGIFDALPLISFAFGCHMQMIPIYGELKDNHEPRRINAVILSTSSICVILYSITAVFGYIQFPKTVAGNILKNYSDDDILVNIARAMLCFVIVCHYPPSNYCCRAALDYLFVGNAKPSTPRRLIWTFLIWALAAITSFLVPKIDVVFGLIGATANSLIVFIFPALFLIHCTTVYDWEGVKSFPAYLLGVTILVVGIIICIFGTSMIVIDNWFPDALDF